MRHIKSITIKNGQKIIEWNRPEPIEPTEGQKILLSAIDKVFKRLRIKKSLGVNQPKTPQPTIDLSHVTKERIKQDAFAQIGGKEDDFLSNSSLPWPTNKVISDHFFLPISLKKGFRITIDPRKKLEPGEVVINDMTYQVGADSTLNMYSGGHYDKIDLHLGDGMYVDKKYQQKHIGTPWSYFVWQVIPPKITHPLSDRTHWLCLMNRRDQHRDLIAKHFIQSNLFERQNYFVYDQITAKYKKHLLNKMFRKIDPNGNPFPKSVDVLLPGNHRSKIISLGNRFKGWDQWEWIHYTKEYQSAMIDLVSETTTKYFYITEKTMKPLAYGIPFVIVGCHKFLARLRKMGFKTFHPYIDESYDNESDLASRVDKAFKSFEEYIKKDKPLKEIQNICDHNRSVVKKIQETHNYQDRIWKKLSNKIKDIPQVD